MCPHRFQIKVLKAKANYTFPYFSMIFIRRKKKCSQEERILEEKREFWSHALLLTSGTN